MGPKGGVPPQYERVFSIAFFTRRTENFSIGELSNDAMDVWGLNPTTAVADTQHSTVPIDTLAFLLLKIEYLAGNDNASLWVNPNLALGEAGLGTAQASFSDPDMTFNRVRLSAGASQTSEASGGPRIVGRIPDRRYVCRRGAGGRCDRRRF